MSTPDTLAETLPRLMAASPQILMHRTLHPVGQGGFYTERFYYLENSETIRQVFTVVYDCGSAPADNIKAQVRKTFIKTKIIDALYLSHFDSDHISGLEELAQSKIKIRYLILPLLKTSQKLLAFLETGFDIFTERAIKNRWENIENIIFINSASDFQENRHPNNENYNNQSETVFSETSHLVYNTVESGIRFHINLYIPWCYIPFNVCDETEYDSFLSKLRKSHHELAKKLERLPSNTHSDIYSMLSEEDIEKLKGFYKSFSSNDRNKTSVILYSGPCRRRAWKKNYLIVPASSLIDSYLGNISSMGEEIAGDYRVGALYTGDIDFNLYVKDNSGNVLKAYDFIGQKLNDFVRFIGLMQIPHHGSRHNFNSAITKSFPTAGSYFYSVGTKNKYRHPFPGIKLWLQAEGKKVYEITERPESEFTQLIKIK